ncbi:hypothetical protein FJZ19_04140 [Candidatus Pacearchaeota archaeon]|nr:hypothetical protein [Candidatus Pacearchaeota archaeon]
MVKKIFVFEIVAGILLLIVSYILAIIYHYNKFYTILLLGLFFILKPMYKIINKREFLSLKNFFKVYLAFFMLGIVADLIFGIWITKLWFYPDYNLINYIILYFFIYPFGGFIVIYSFALIESLAGKKPRERKKDYFLALNFSKILFFLGMVFLIIAILFANSYKGFLIYVFFGLMGYGLTNYVTLKYKKDDLLERILTKTSKYVLLIAIVAYTQGIIHEFPNVFAREWIYQNFPLNNLTLLGIPIMVLLFCWLWLVVVPYSIFELVMTLNKKFKRRRDEI